ncbi:MAG TPA: hypothetical protein IAA35_02550 [Candidatus Alistipes faecigallinarum]|uniref:hypothetical protein n=1 Tax=uncultured Alistipes sp. TaxID=538949 RepID=UPI001FA6A6BD|nr:hypothetical protein [uncultured Alistipes sp.]HIY46903.1 hypothetical protein [Candidatus Alistipes faecigallinarum]
MFDRFRRRKIAIFWKTPAFSRRIGEKTAREAFPKSLFGKTAPECEHVDNFTGAAMEKATKKVRGILANPEEFSYLCVRKK